ncbi:MAG TPA: 16S rRNA (cytidine(1402)-2'-O)-methyltransferase [Candidatus Absconditabacterales bacterium]|nr:16S rRNA (cytidine(1402)-2'-O)-methyltransferase [Candidatus Absconditabacterales bacterium]
MLSIIPTPIGNKEDITLRAMRLLSELDIFFCEDVMTTKKLMQLYEIDYKLKPKTFYPFTSFVSDNQMSRYIQLAKDCHVGLVCEAGTPGLSDPAKSFVRQCRIHSIPFEVLPGANALIPLVVASNRDTTEFTFVGFLPKKKGRKTMMQYIIKSPYPIYCYESVHRIEKTLVELKTLGFVGQVMIGRELTKFHEQYIYGNIDTIVGQLQDKSIILKGEFVLGLRPD